MKIIIIIIFSLALVLVVVSVKNIIKTHKDWKAYVAPTGWSQWGEPVKKIKNYLVYYSIGLILFAGIFSYLIYSFLNN